MAREGICTSLRGQIPRREKTGAARAAVVAIPLRKLVPPADLLPWLPSRAQELRIATSLERWPFQLPGSIDIALRVRQETRHFFL